jgi:hypothetical protein
MLLPHIDTGPNEPATLFAMVDCAQFSRDFFRWLRNDDKIQYKSLFDDTPDRFSVMSGPVLIQVIDAPKSITVRHLLDADAQKKSSAITWLWSREGLNDLFKLLQSILYVKMPDGSMSICRFYDPRCLEFFLQFFEGKDKELHKKLQQIVAWAYWKDKTYAIINSNKATVGA